MAAHLSSKQLAILREAPAPRGGNRLRLAMTLANVKLGLLSRHVDAIGYGSLSELVNGRARNPSLLTVQQLAAFFGCTIEDLFPPVSKTRAA